MWSSPCNPHPILEQIGFRRVMHAAAIHMTVPSRTPVSLTRSPFKLQLLPSNTHAHAPARLRRERLLFFRLSQGNPLIRVVVPLSWGWGSGMACLITRKERLGSFFFADNSTSWLACCRVCLAAVKEGTWIHCPRRCYESLTLSARRRVTVRHANFRARGPGYRNDATCADIPLLTSSIFVAISRDSEGCCVAKLPSLRNASSPTYRPGCAITVYDNAVVASAVLSVSLLRR